MPSFRRLVILFLLAWMPLQSIAAPLLAWHCDAQGRQGTQSVDESLPCHEHASAAAMPSAFADAAATMLAASDDDAESDNAACKSGDFCCAHFSALPATRVINHVEPAPFEAIVPTLPRFSFLATPLTHPPRA